MIDACFSLFLVHDASFMSAAHHCLRHLFRSFSLCFSRICFLYIDRLGASGSLGLIVNKRLDLILCLPLSPNSGVSVPLSAFAHSVVCLRAFYFIQAVPVLFICCPSPIDPGVPDSFPDSLTEWEKLEDMIALTDSYMDHGEILPRNRKIARLLLNPQSASSSLV